MCPIKCWSRRKEARPQEIIEAALALFVEKGYAATKIEDIARAAGVTRGTPYLYFANKEEIFKSVIRSLLLPQLAIGATLLQDWQGSARDLLQELFHLWWRNVGATSLSALPKLMIAEGGNFPEVMQLYNEEVTAPGQAMLRHVLTLGVARGEFVINDIDYAAHILSSPMVMAMLLQNTPLHCLPADFCAQRYVQCTVDLFLTGLLARPMDVSHAQ
ncbi:TetR/AcrR family transcriptional regulator [Deefgea salmonis]|uniref:TetR/AcrR family transcriptional regulator n=1 Tax=Deefgea salmonis TaxID=2875502 RepID=A0ABS8BMX3_9NEIS|nr:TetR/AcrR family transcriptional regulator [Deefgea salmonis]MCB5196934.1 TetR/AcrR family transcriptional regulator [Deefgea salmonis]